MTIERDGLASVGSPDATVIRRAIARQRRLEAYLQAASEQDSELKAAEELRSDFEFLASCATLSRYATRPRNQIRLRRILIRRFGALGARYLLLCSANVSDTHFRIILRERNDQEKPDGGRSRRNLRRDVADYELLSAVMRQERVHGLTGDAAIKAALKDLSRVSRGVEGAKKALNRARKNARERRYADPMATFLPMFFGFPVGEPALKVAELRGRGRPKNRKKCVS